MSEIWGAYFQEGLFLKGLIIGILWYFLCSEQFTKIRDLCEIDG